jgi:hypothetical protein
LVGWLGLVVGCWIGLIWVVWFGLVGWLGGWVSTEYHFVSETNMMVHQISKIVILKLIFFGTYLCTKQHGIES